MSTEAVSPEPKGKDPSKEDGKTSRGEGVSAFLGKVFEQLSLSTWLPSTMLVGNAAVLLTIQSQAVPNLGSAITSLTEQPLGIIIVVLFALLMVTIVMQAFEFETIRLLEGYNHIAFPPVQWLAALRIRRHIQKRAKVLDRHSSTQQAAFDQAWTIMASMPAAYDPIKLDILKRRINGLPQPVGVDTDLLGGALRINWKNHAPAALRFQLAALDARIGSYPAAEGRVLPTRLGNVLRAAEDMLTLADDENLEGFVIRNHDQLPATLQIEHGDYRTRLDMYCSLVLVFVVLAALSAWSLAAAGPLAMGLSATAFLGMGWLSYEAAIASARGYGEALQEIDRFVQRELAEARARMAVDTTPDAPSRGRLRTLLHRYFV